MESGWVLRKSYFEKKKLAISVLPEEPGIYQFFNKENNLIYVGKAKNIKKRVSSYFLKSASHNKKTKKLVTEIEQIQYTVTPTEYDALLLENNVIKQNQPKYNILLKDDKTFPYICITQERFPRLITTRNYNSIKGEYFGPYTSVLAMKNVLNLIRELYTIRTCKYNLSETNVRNKKYKLCLEYHIQNCKGPCEGLQTEEDYNRDIENCRYILKGNLGVVKGYFHEQMLLEAENLQFEKAHVYKEKVSSLDKYHSKSVVVNPKLSNIDVISIISDQDNAFVNFMRVEHGAIIISQTIRISKKLDESDEDILGLVIVRFQEKYTQGNKEVFSNIPIPHLPTGMENTVPKIGDKKKLIDLSVKNCLEYKKELLLREAPGENKVLVQMKNDLQLQDIPKHIECFDNSNIQGTNPVASMVCFRNGRPAKKDYRHYHIKSVVGPDDFASMYEVVTRRYQRLLEEESPLPQLVVIDGGKGQLNSAVKALKDLDLYGKVAIIGIAKRLEEIYYPGDSIPVHLSKKSPTLTLIRRLRDEAHRFAITFHRNIRSKSSLKVQLTEIEGIGNNTVMK
ncbi:MAG: excinuclease ABC subunit UvrC, partial [Cyclobacteriaceae bacterium]|nr:excinuclease ABC subunit UvrC [Cyclobacteriaceae bacterium]